MSVNGLTMKRDAYEIEKKNEVIAITFRQGLEVTPAMIMDGVRDVLLVDEGRNRNDIWDFRGCLPSSELSYDSVTRIVDFIRSSRGDSWNEKTAILGDAVVTKGLLRMFQILSDDHPLEIEIFENQADAMAWLASTDSGSQDPHPI